MAQRVVLVHGAWHGAWMWEPLLPALRARGLDPVTIDLPTARGEGDLYGDAALVRALVQESDEPTVLVGHSYGGGVISQAGAGLPQVARLVYICSFLFDVAETLETARMVTPPWQRIDLEAGLLTVDDPATVFFNDLDPARAAAWGARLGPQALVSFTQPLTVAAWHEVPSTYVVTTRDQAIPVAVQRSMAARATTVVELDTGHSPFASQPEALAAIIAGADQTIPASR